MQIHFIRPEEIKGRTVLVEGAEAKHIVKVLRHGVGDTLTFTDGTGHYLRAKIDRASASAIHAEIIEQFDDPREAEAPWSTLGLALLKGDHFELAIEKCTELGVHRIVPLIADHNVVKWKKEGAAKKLARWQRIAESATKQSGRSWCPEIAPPLSIEQLLDETGDASAVIVADEAETATSVFSLDLGPTQAHVALVGPEGAFSAAEKSLLDERGTRAVSLSPFRLRSETAAIALVAALHKGRPIEHFDA